MNDKLKHQIARRIAAWINTKGIDSHVSESDWNLAEQIMERKLMWTGSNGDTSALPSINEILDGAECEV